MFPIESETLHDSIKVFISLEKNISFCVIDLYVSIQITTKALTSAVFQNTKWQTVQQCKTCILNIYILKTINTFDIKTYLI